MRPLSHRDVARAFGVVLKLAREEVALTQEQLADRAHLDRTTPGLYERGRRQPTLGTVIDIATALGLEPAALVTMTVERLRQ